MGMFDTIILEPPLSCPTCGSPMEIQTKLFDSLMQSYRIGGVISGSPVLYGVLTEEAFCWACSKAERQARTELFLVVWHTILAGVELSQEAAELRLAAVDRLDLIRWLDDAQKREEAWRRRLRSLYSDVSRWHEELERRNRPQEEETDRAGSIRRMLSLPDEILNADDPLAEILARHKDESPDEDPWV
mgnify:FL=1